MERLSEAMREELDTKLHTNFKPTTPVNSYELFCGRQRQSRALMAAVNQNGQHAILFGERGVGKTSLANILFYLIDCPGWPKTAPIINCTRNDTYGTLWSRVLIEIMDRADKDGIELPKRALKSMRLAKEGYPETVTMDVVRSVLTAIGEKALVVVVLDEFDTLANKEVRASVADTIKYLSDRNAPCTVVVVGVADDVNGLIADHQSVERCLAQVRMPRMTRDELEAVITRCLDNCGMKIQPAALHEISRISKGLPHYAHLLGLHSSLSAIETSSLIVTQRHVTKALDLAIENALQSIQDAYLRATESSQRTAQYHQLLVACALAETNDHGYFSPADVREPLSMILKKPAKIENFTKNLHAFCEDDAGTVLGKITIRGRPQFRFRNALMQPFTIIKGLAQKIITEDDLHATRDPNDPQKRLF